MGIFYWAKIQLDQPGPLATSTVFAVPKGEGGSSVARPARAGGHYRQPARLHDQHPLLQIYLKGQGSLKAGEYEFRKYATMREVLDTLVEGKSIEHKVTLAEGLTSYQIVQKLMAPSRASRRDQGGPAGRQSAAGYI